MLNNGKNAILILVVLFFILPSFMINAESIATAQTNNIAQNNQQIDDVRSQSSSSKVQGSAAASIQIFFCSLLIVGYIFHIFVVYKHLRDLDNPTNRSSEPFGNYIANDWRDPTRWTFLLSTILLPIGLYFVSETFSSNGILSQADRSSGVIWQRLAYTFSMAVFIIMITLEISYIYNLVDDYWRKILTGALTLDFIAFLGYSLMGEPQQTYLNEPVIFNAVFLFLAGLASLISSFLTLYFTRTHERFFIGNTSDFVAESSEKTKGQRP